MSGSADKLLRRPRLAEEDEEIVRSAVTNISVKCVRRI